MQRETDLADSGTGESTSSSGSRPGARRLGRRRLLRLGAVGAGTALAGCSIGGAGESQQPQTPTDSPNTNFVDVAAAQLGDGPVPVHIWVDLDDSDAQRWESLVWPSINEYVDNGHVSLYHHDYPRPATDLSVPAAHAGRELLVEDYGAEFWRYRHLLLTKYADVHTMEALEQVANDIGADPETLVEIASAKPHQKAIAADKALIEPYGVGTLPKIAIGEEAEILGPSEAFDIDKIESLIESRLAQQ
jgi:hypothetical protein